MKLLKKLLLPLVIAGSVHSVWAADQNVPFSSSFHVSADDALKAKLPEDILKRGYIVAGTNPNTPPTTFYMADNKTLAGREIDVMTAVAERLGVAVQWRDTGGFDNIIPGLKSGRYDVDFIGYFDASRLGIISRKDANVAPFTSLQDTCGKQVGAGAGTTQLLRLDEASKKCVADGKPAITIATFPDRPAGVQAVVSGRVAMFFGPYEGLTYQVSKVPVLAMSGQITVNDAPVSIAFPKASPLEDAVQAALNSLIKDGSYQKILDKWNIGYGAMKEAKRNEEIF
jgi:polar amino acid transport system substrate-binding protein